MCYIMYCRHLLEYIHSGGGDEAMVMPSSSTWQLSLLRGSVGRHSARFTHALPFLLAARSEQGLPIPGSSVVSANPAGPSEQSFQHQSSAAYRTRALDALPLVGGRAWHTFLRWARFVALVELVESWQRGMLLRPQKPTRPAGKRLLHGLHGLHGRQTRCLPTIV